VAVAVVVVDGLVDSEQPTSANMIVTTRSGVAHRIVRMLATADRSTVASTWLWLNVFTSRRMREIVCGPGLVGLQRVSRIGSCDINAGEMCWCSARTQLRHALGQRAEVDVNEIITGEIEILEARRFGGAWLLDQLWRRLGVGTAPHRVAADRRLDATTVERVLFALVAQRALEPGSKLAATRRVAERVAIPGCGGFSDDAA
jgi:hypothetical protein